MILRVANPIYDSVFKYLVEDLRIAKILISALLKKEVLEVEVRKHEYTNGTRDNISMFRIDFGAKVRESDGSFVESLVHDSIIVQIPRLHGRVNNRLEKVLSVFDQTHKDKGNRQMLNIDEDNYEDDTDMMYILRRLLAAASDAKLRQDMNVEDEYFTAIENRDTAIMNRDKKIAEQDQYIAEQSNQIAEQSDCREGQPACRANEDFEGYNSRPCQPWNVIERHCCGDGQVGRGYKVDNRLISFCILSAICNLCLINLIIY